MPKQWLTKVGDILTNNSNELGESLSKNALPTHSIGDALTTSNSISNATSNQQNVLDITNEINEYFDNTSKDIPSFRDALTISNHTTP